PMGGGNYRTGGAGGKLHRRRAAGVGAGGTGVGVALTPPPRPLRPGVPATPPGLAPAIVPRRDADGPFRTRQQLMGVPRLGPKAFEQCAGFLRIRGGDDPLDASGVHPEAYPVVRRILATTKSTAAALIRSTVPRRALRPDQITDDRFGLPTVTDILRELEKPGRDPRPAFATATFAEGVEKLEDLEPGMVLEGVVTNVAAFGAFVDIGVHQDGLVHVSAMSRTFVSDPRSVVKSGDVVRVKVLSVDVARHRISLSLRLDDEGDRPFGPSSRTGRAPRPRPAPGPSGRAKDAPAPQGALADALRRAGLVPKPPEDPDRRRRR